MLQWSSNELVLLPSRVLGHAQELLVLVVTIAGMGGGGALLPFGEQGARDAK